MAFILWITLNRPDPDTYEDIPRLTCLLRQREIFLKFMLAQGFKGFKNRGGFIQSVMLSMAYFIVFLRNLVLIAIERMFEFCKLLFFPS